MILIDSNVLLDVWDPDPAWQAWSSGQLWNQSLVHELVINPIIYAEISVSFATPAALDRELANLEITMLSLPAEAAFLAGKAFVRYRRQGGTKSNILADFLVGAHAMVLGCALLTRDTRRYGSYFPAVPLIAP